MNNSSSREDGTLIPAHIAKSLVTPSAYAGDEIHDAYRWLRANNPMGIAAPDGFDPFWVVTKHSDILLISRNNELFRNALRPATLTSITDTARAYETTGTPSLVRSLVDMDEPDHMKYRRLTQFWFLPGNLKKREDAIRAIARKTVGRMIDTAGNCDFVGDVALHYPLEVVMNILGVPEHDYPRMLRLTQELFGPQDPDIARKAANGSDAAHGDLLRETIQDFTDYFESISADRRRRPREDLATLIATAEIDAKPIPPFEVTGYYMILAAAGHDTTSSSTAGAMWGLATVLGLLEELKAEPSRIPDLVEEAIRWATPVKTFMRTASADTELGGRKLRKGDWLMLCYASGNRDEDVFDNPFAFDIDRPSNRKQLAFGNGAHVCLGQHLARMEMRILFEELLPRLQSIELCGDPAMTESCFVNGLKRLPLRFEMTTA